MPWRRLILAVVAGVLVAAAVSAAGWRRVSELMIVVADETLPASVVDPAYGRTVHGLTAAVCALPGVVAAVWIAIRPPQHRRPRATVPKKIPMLRPRRMNRS